MLKQFEKERNDVEFNRNCVFCKQQFTGNRSQLFTHIAEDHNFCVGQPDNIVFVDEFLNLLDDKINKKLECPYCDGSFKEKAALKEHMRKKQHKHINPKKHGI